jgi:UDPglucose 6-dehydrogenase
MHKLSPKQVRPGYDKGFIDGYNQAVDDHLIERGAMIGVIGHSGVVGKAIYNAFPGSIGLSSKEGSYEEMAKADIVFMAVPTPSKKDGSINMDILYSCMDEMQKHKTKEQIVVVKSTVVPGTNKYLTSNYDFEFVSSPEFLTELNAETDFLTPDRVVIGANSKEAFDKVIDSYSKILPDGTQIVRCKPIEAELIKYYANCFLAMKVIYANEAKTLCDEVGADYDKVKLGVSLDSRIGDSHLSVTEKGGYSGMCFPKDTKGFSDYSKKIGIKQELIETMVKLNKEIREK